MDGMSNQRRGSRHSAAMNDNGHELRKVINFMEQAAEDLEKMGYEDPAFYFQQVADWCRENPQGLSAKPSLVLGL